MLKNLAQVFHQNTNIIFNILLFIKAGHCFVCNQGIILTHIKRSLFLCEKGLKNKNREILI